MQLWLANLEHVAQIEIVNLPQRLVIAFEIANALHTPLPHPDMSSPSNNLENLFLINSMSSIICSNQYILENNEYFPIATYQWNN